MNIPPPYGAYLGPQTIVGTNSCGDSMALATAESSRQNGSWTQPDPVFEEHVGTSAAIAKCKKLKLRGFAALGKFASLTGVPDLVEAERLLRLDDQHTLSATRGVFMRDGEAPRTFFAPPSASTILRDSPDAGASTLVARLMSTGMSYQQASSEAVNARGVRSNLHDVTGRGDLRRR